MQNSAWSNACKASLASDDVGRWNWCCSCFGFKSGNILWRLLVLSRDEWLSGLISDLLSGREASLEASFGGLLVCERSFSIAYLLLRSLIWNSSLYSLAFFNASLSNSYFKGYMSLKAWIWVGFGCERLGDLRYVGCITAGRSLCFWDASVSSR